MEQRIQDEAINRYQQESSYIVNSAFQVLNTVEGIFGGFYCMQAKLIIKKVK